MSSERLSRLRNFNARVRRIDPKVTEESMDLRPEVFQEGMQPGDLTERPIVEESIVLRRTRPVLAIYDNETKLVFVDPADSAICCRNCSR